MSTFKILTEMFDSLFLQCEASVDARERGLGDRDFSKLVAFKPF